MKKNRTIALLCFIVLSLAVLAALFYFSGQDAPASKGVSQSVAARILQLFKVDYTAAELSLFNNILRKAAHFTLFTALGVCVTCVALCLKKRQAVCFALAFGVAVAALNEAHQLFSPGRGAELRDVLLDSAGFLVGWGACLLCVALLRRLRRARG